MEDNNPFKKPPVNIRDKDSSQTNEESEDTKRFESNLRQIIEDFSTQSKIMIDALYERQQNRLTPLQNNEQFQGMVSHIKNIKNFEEKFNIESIEKINENINKLSRLFNDMKFQPVGNRMAEDSQNVEKLISGAKIFSASCQESGRKLPIEMENKKMEEKSKELRLSLDRLSREVQNLWMFAVKLRENM
ncbi:MAG: hypothetical protein NT161_00435 [Candidatus Nomurabacteria bacterium]|nr:hypothetical protein [Candidatus Nomurabacteria bacterium]